MKSYMVELPHSSDQCNVLMGEIEVKDPDILENTFCSCPSEHKCWGILQAEDEIEARRKFAGESMMSNARAYEVQKMTVETMQKMHM